MRDFFILISCLFGFLGSHAQLKKNVKHRVLISTDIGGTDPDDNQSMIHLLMYSDRFNLEGLVSSPSFGAGSKQSILDMIDLYANDFAKLNAQVKGLISPDQLRLLTKQGQKGSASYKGYSTPTEGSNWIIHCANRKSKQPLWILVWGGLDDLAQALHDDPSIQHKINVYWIGGPNKKWSANSYAYIAQHFPNLWFIENNFSYNGFFSNRGMADSVKTTAFYEQHIKGAGYMGAAFLRYYNGNIKMGDTPSLLYMMYGDPMDPFKESWGGSFQHIDHSSRTIFERMLTLSDTIRVCSILELHLKGPQLQIHPDSSCFTLKVKSGIGEQSWSGYYIGNGEYVVRYVPKQSETIHYSIVSSIPEFPNGVGQFVVDKIWPGKRIASDYALGKHWFSDKDDPTLFDGMIQGGNTIKKWRNEVLNDWAVRWSYLK